MGDNVKDIERHIDERRSRLNQDINELERKAQDVFDWRTQMERHPGTMLGLAFGAGVLISAVLTGPGRQTRYVSESDGQTTVFGVPHAQPYPEPSAAGAAWDKIKGALVVAALTKFEGIVQEVLPEFKLGENTTDFHSGTGSAGSASQTVH